jgi:4'-phosphopantetheinyl transferase
LEGSTEKILQTLLNDKEKARADRFHFEKDRYRFSQFRGFLRFILGQYLQKAPHGIALEENPQGKPFLSSQRTTSLYFNLTHSEGLALFALSRVGDLGVDVEKIKNPYHGEELAEQNFSPQEAAYLNSVPPDKKAETFFRLWTLKEAYLKALGLGFSGGLDTFSVKINESGGTATLSGRLPEDRGGSWRLQYFEVDKDFVGAVAAPEGAQEIQCFDGNRIQVYKSP